MLDSLQRTAAPCFRPHTYRITPCTPLPLPQDVFDPEITLLAPGSVTTALASDSVNRTLEPGSEVLFSFLANKGPGAPHSLAGLAARLCSARRQSDLASRCRQKGACMPPRTTLPHSLFSLSSCSRCCPPTGELNASNPYNVGAIQSVTFNNLRCSMVMAALPPQAPAPAPAAEAVAVPTDLQIEYTPIECECHRWPSRRTTRPRPAAMC